MWTLRELAESAVDTDPQGRPGSNIHSKYSMAFAPRALEAVVHDMAPEPTPALFAWRLVFRTKGVHVRKHDGIRIRCL